MAGWPEHMGLTEADFLALVHRQQGVTLAPGIKQLYINTGYALLSLTVRKISGLSLRKFAAQTDVRFQRDAVIRLTGFDVNAGDITNIWFAKMK